MTNDRRDSEPRSRRREIAVIALVLISTALVLGKDITVGGLRHGDSAAHAMDGVLIHDWLASGPAAWVEPMAFARAQYAHYPTLGIGRHYPPGFAMVEAGFFAMFGVSPVSARLCVLFFGLVAATGIYTYVRPLRGRTAAAFAAIALVAMPATTQWGRQVMLELPTMAVLTWAAVAFRRYLDRPTIGRLAVALLIALTTVLFKQPGVFLVGAIAVTLLIAGITKAAPLRHSALALAIALAAVVGVALSLDGHGGQLLSGDATFPERWSWAALSFYLRQVPRGVGPWCLVAAGVGALTGARQLGRHGVFLLAWFATCYVMLSIADYKNPRFLYLGFFPFAVAAGVGAAYVLTRIRSVNLRRATAAVCWATCCMLATMGPVEDRPDYGTVVVARRDHIIGRAVLFSGLRDGDFVFAVRQHLPWRSAVVIRGSKLLYTCNGRADLDFVSHVGSASDMRALMRKFAFRSVFLETKSATPLEEDALLRNYLVHGGAYRSVASYAFKMAGGPSYRDATLEVYELNVPLERQVEHVDILIQRAKQTIRVRLKGWL